MKTFEHTTQLSAIKHTLSNLIIRNRTEIQAIIKLMVYSWCTN